jgi:DtxR family Mn-dependent transcriptional regulator
MKTLSHAEENYLKAIWKLVGNRDEQVSTNAIAALVNTRAASVTDMLKKLADKKFILYKPYRGVRLSAKGMSVAAEVVRKHRLWEVFLVKQLGYKWDEVHEIAEQLEHIRSETLTDKLDQFLGYPKTDPHGDPIPDKSGKIRGRQSVSLSSLRKNEKGIMTGVADDDSKLLHFLDAHHIHLGSTITVAFIHEYDLSMEIVLNKNKIVVSEMIADHILVNRKHV